MTSGGMSGLGRFWQRRCFPAAEIHAFEPLVGHITAFRNNTEGIAGIQLHALALGASKDRLPMQVASFSDASSLLQIGAEMADHFDVHKAREEIVTVERLDDYVADQGMPMPDLIKLDVQGYELQSLRGGLGCLRHAVAVLTEVSFIEFYPGQCLFEEVVEFMAAEGFRLRFAFHYYRPGTIVDPNRRTVCSKIEPPAMRIFLDMPAGPETPRGSGIRILAELLQTRN